MDRCGRIISSGLRPGEKPRGPGAVAVWPCHPPCAAYEAAGGSAGWRGPVHGGPQRVHGVLVHAQHGCGPEAIRVPCQRLAPRHTSVGAVRGGYRSPPMGPQGRATHRDGWGKPLARGTWGRAPDGGVLAGKPTRLPTPRVPVCRVQRHPRCAVPGPDGSGVSHGSRRRGRTWGLRHPPPPVRTAHGLVWCACHARTRVGRPPRHPVAPPRPWAQAVPPPWPHDAPCAWGVPCRMDTDQEGAEAVVIVVGCADQPAPWWGPPAWASGPRRP